MSSPTATELLPCPFCGNTDIDPEFSYYQEPAEEGGKKYGHEPGCMKCGATAPIDVWNRRTISATGTSAKISDAEIIAAMRTFGQGHKLGAAYDFEDVCAVVDAVLQARSNPSANAYTEIGVVVDVPDGLGTRIVAWNEEREKLPAGAKIYAASTTGNPK